MRLIKIDVEGMEPDVIAGGRSLIQNFRPLLYLENDRLENSVRLIGMILALQYDIYWHLPPYFRVNNFMKNRKNVFPNLVSVNMFCIPHEQNKQALTLTKVVGATDRPPSMMPDQV